MTLFLSIAAAAVAGFLGWHLYRRAGAARIHTITEKRRATSRLVSGGEFVDGNRHLKVALALTDRDLFYENADMQANLDLRWVREVEYDTRLMTGNTLEGTKVLRVRCGSQLFEFVLPEAVVPDWQRLLPPQADVAMAPGQVAAPLMVAT